MNENKKWYCYRNPMTGSEVKRYEPMTSEEMQNTGYEFVRMYDYSVKDWEKNANKKK